MATTYPIVKISILGKTITFQDEDVIEAEVTQEIHPVSIEVPASTARIRVWLDDTTRDNISILVSFAGVSGVRGYYTQYTLHDGKPCFKKLSIGTPGSSYYIVWVSEYSAWCISTFAEDSSYKGALYRSFDDVATPDLCTTWVNVSDNGGVLPLPVVTYESGGHTMREKFSPFSDGEYYQAMSTGLVVDVSESVDGAEHSIGRFYLEEWNNPKEGELELICTDAIGTLENKKYLGNFYETPTLVSRIIGDIFAGVGILYEVDSQVASKLLKGYIPGNITLREALQQVLFACGAYAMTTGAAMVKIKPSIIPDPTFVIGDIDVVITDEEKTDSQALNILPLVTGVEIVSHDYSKGQTLEEIFSAYLTPGDYMVVYPKPYWHVEATGVGDAVTYLATTEGKVLVTPDSPDNVPITTLGVTVYTIYGEFDFGVNYVYLHVPEPGGTAVVSGKPWLDATQIFSWANPGSGTAQPNVWKIDDATLVPSITTSSEEAIADVLGRVAAYASLRYQQRVSLFPRTDVDLGNIALVDSLYGKDVVGVIEKLSSNLSGGYLIETEIVGTEHEE